MGFGGGAGGAFCLARFTEAVARGIQPLVQPRTPCGQPWSWQAARSRGCNVLVADATAGAAGGSLQLVRWCRHPGGLHYRVTMTESYVGTRKKGIEAATIAPEVRVWTGTAQSAR